ncbi:MAG: beta-ketodecanoyl-[acyl-carrier-protein] synthase [Candidatus Binatota bacterium]|nr:beta-ketodecanoyl-[acyl-carrier-protein] synthase [Candidatus Binatota bacterium]
MNAPGSAKAVIRASGLYTPPESISNDELVASFNEYVRRENEKRPAGEALQPSSSEFILKASGVRSRHVVDRAGILDPEIMRPQIRTRSREEPSLLCEMALAAANEALERAGRAASDVDAVLVACSNLQRPYPAIAVEVQHRLGTRGYAFDMNVACASAAFGVQVACDAVTMGSARSALVLSPEVCSGHLNFRDRDSHFIFGDAATAVLIERDDGARGTHDFEVLGTRLATRFSNNIRNEFGFLNRAETEPRTPDELLFVQDGRTVFREVVPMVAELLASHLADLGIRPDQVRRYWLHQANLSMNQLILKRLLGRPANEDEAPIVLDEYANTSSAGSVIAFHRHQAGLEAGDVGVLCAFGAGYSAGSIVVRKR